MSTRSRHTPWFGPRRPPTRAKEWNLQELLDEAARVPNYVVSNRDHYLGRAFAAEAAVQARRIFYPEIKANVTEATGRPLRPEDLERAFERWMR